MRGSWLRLRRRSSRCMAEVSAIVRFGAKFEVARGPPGIRAVLRCRPMIPGSLKGKTLFITGASRGIGKAIALRAAQDGANVVIAAKTTEAHPKLPGTIYSA